MKTALPLCGLVLLAHPAHAVTWHVPTQVPTVLAGLDSAAAFDTVLVAPGTYSSTDTRNVDLGNGPEPVTAAGFLKSSVYLVSEAGSGATTLELGTSPVAGQGAVLAGRLGSTGFARIYGFRIVAPPGGTGVLAAYGSGVQVRDCELGEETSHSASGITSLYAADLEVMDCTFDGLAGAVYQLNGELDMEGCLVTNCSGTWGAVHADGPSFNGTRVTIRSTEFVGNSATTLLGGGAFSSNAHGLSSATIEDCRFVDNTSTYRGGAIKVTGADPTASVAIDGCVFLRNVAASGGGAVWLQTHASISGNTFHKNGPGGGVGAALLLEGFGAGYTVTNNIFSEHGNRPAVHDDGSGSLTPGCNLYWGDALGPVDPTDRTGDPRYCDEAADDLSVAVGSPAMRTPCGLIGALGPGCGSVLVDGFARDVGRVSASPDPSRKETELTFSLPAAGAAEIRIHDVAGRLVERLSASSLPEGEHRVTWNGSSRPGVYFVRVLLDGKPVAHGKVVRLEG